MRPPVDERLIRRSGGSRGTRPEPAPSELFHREHHGRQEHDEHGGERRSPSEVSVLLAEDSSKTVARSWPGDTRKITWLTAVTPRTKQ